MAPEIMGQPPIPMPRAALVALPNEVLLEIFSLIPTLNLLSLTPIHSRIYAIILRVLHDRLVRAAHVTFKTHALHFSCHPSFAHFRPLWCEYLGTPGLDCDQTGQLSASARRNEEASWKGRWNPDSSPARLGELKNLYCRFKPLTKGNRWIKRKKLFRITLKDFDYQTQGVHRQFWWQEDANHHITRRQVYLEDGELFTQLVATASLLRLDPHRIAEYPSWVGHRTEEDVKLGRGVVRLWRDWLGSAVKDVKDQVCAVIGTSKEKDAADKIMWINPTENIGIKFGVNYGEVARNILVYNPREDVKFPFRYTLQYDGELLRIPFHHIPSFASSCLFHSRTLCANITPSTHVGGRRRTCREDGVLTSSSLVLSLSRLHIDTPFRYPSYDPLISFHIRCTILPRFSPISYISVESNSLIYGGNVQYTPNPVFDSRRQSYGNRSVLDGRFSCPLGFSLLSPHKFIPRTSHSYLIHFGGAGEHVCTIYTIM
ncbi:hypothetical protein M501DRAFT_997325 [Patellaria atrata CBS 101060]|uniref:F-box domain-containing protein n=1 Tax=Patellaria atrata CBS 101060 TaxID=1346257 RepID=A0A9P4VQ20_9PEZI|nr:hypothetical protein M501DRAFT_1004129 [Patellaria atrata CBS 101060]KAF2836084.1 hypothetical protein M501DRAFT_997325 [Patellaria atrata CBS 101060]